VHSGLIVRLGDYDVGDPNDVKHYESSVSQVIIHPQFNRQNLANDVALVRLAQPVPLSQYTHITPACLPSPGQLFEGQRYELFSLKIAASITGFCDMFTYLASILDVSFLAGVRTLSNLVITSVRYKKLTCR